MSYEPTQWKDGDLVTSAKLNKIEQGIAAGGGVLIVHVDKNADICYIIRRDEEWSDCQLVTGTEIDDGLYFVGVFNFMNPPQTYATDSPSGYPILYIDPNDTGNVV